VNSRSVVPTAAAATPRAIAATPRNSALPAPSLRPSGPQRRFVSTLQPQPFRNRPLCIPAAGCRVPTDSMMTEIKIDCRCGTRYAFEVEPENARVPVEVQTEG